MTYQHTVEDRGLLADAHISLSCYANGLSMWLKRINVRDFYILHEENKELFELGGGPWGGRKYPGSEHQHFNEVPLDLNTRRTAEEFQRHVLEVWNSGYVEPGNDEHIKRVAYVMWRWCEARDWKVRVVSDHDNDCHVWIHYLATDSGV